MKTSLQKTLVWALAAIFSLSIAVTTVAIAADDPSIKGSLRENIKTSMMSFIEGNMIGDTYYIYDSCGGYLSMGCKAEGAAQGYTVLGGIVLLVMPPEFVVPFQTLFEKLSYVLTTTLFAGVPLSKVTLMRMYQLKVMFPLSSNETA